MKQDWSCLLLSGKIDLGAMSSTELIAFLKKEVKKANTRLVALEKADMAKTSLAYLYVSSRMSNRHKTTGKSKSGHLKFKTSGYKSMTRSDLLQLAKQVQGFNEASTSTISGVKKMINKSLESGIKKGKINIDKATWAQIVSHKNWNDFKNRIGSDQIIRIINEYSAEDALYILDTIDMYKDIKEMNEKVEELQRNREEERLYKEMHDEEWQEEQNEELINKIFNWEV